MGARVEMVDRGLLEVGNGNSIYWECCGNPDGVPAVYVHGGPGSGCTPGARRFFDEQAYRVVLVDQRGCGRSVPLLEKRSQLAFNTTQHLIGDLESVRTHLSIERWVMFGGSWGSTLALAYSQAHPQRVAGLVLGPVTTTSRREVDWITYDAGRIFPQQWERFASHIPAAMSEMRIVDAYATLLFDDDPSISAAAAVEWCAWEDSHVSLTPARAPDRRFLDSDFRLRFARLVTHYWRHAAFLEDGRLLRDAGSLSEIPGILVHGRYDVSSPLEAAWQLHKAWPKSRLRIAGDAGHGTGSFAQHIVDALNEIRAELP